MAIEVETVKDLIEVLSRLENKNTPVKIWTINADVDSNDFFNVEVDSALFKGVPTVFLLAR